MGKIISIYKGEDIIVGEVKLADTFFGRMFGLMPAKTLDENKGILLKPCKQVHTFYMSFAIDVIFLSKDNFIIHIENNLTRNKVTKYYKEADKILEITSGIAEKHKLLVGDLLSINLN